MKKLVLVFFAGILVGLGTNRLYGWFSADKSSNLDTLRLKGHYQFISPLITCNSSTEAVSPQIQSLEDEVQKLIDVEVSQNTVTAVSVYFRDYNSNESVVINPDEKYYPASLNKIPVMIASYKIAETNPQFLEQKVTYLDNDQNGEQAIKPADFVKVGETYTIRESIEKMIKYSDNNAFYLLARHVDPKVFVSTYKDLQIPMREDVRTPADYMTVENFSYFLRTLYNATYLNKDYSETALRTLSQVDYRNGLVAGVPESIPVAHKFGHSSNLIDGQKVFELHDCGIVYVPQKNYLLCVMTKSPGGFEQAQSVIQRISAHIYTQITREP